MQIVSVRLVNYRCFKDSGEVNLSKFSVLIGRNDGGKSSFLKAIDKTLNRDSNFEPDDCWFEVVDGEEKRETELQVYIRLKTSEGGQYHVRTTYSRTKDSIVWHLESEVVEHEDLNQDFVQLSLDTLKSLCTKYSIAPEGPQNRKNTFTDALIAHRATLPKKPGWVELPANIATSLPRVNLYASVEETGPDKAITDNLNKYFKNDLLGEHQNALTDVRKKVETDLNAHAKSTMLQALSTHCKIVTDVSIELDDTSFTGLKVKRVLITQPDGKTIDWDRIGSGKKREMALGIFRWQHDMLVDQIEDDSTETLPTLVLFDEPDVNLDYAAQRLVNQLLQELAEKHPQTQVVVATHAVNIIDSVSLNSICFFDNHQYQPWRFEFGVEEDEQLEKIRQVLGLSNSSLFNENLIVVVEGPTELAVIPPLYQHIIGKMLILSGVYLINGLDYGQAIKLGTLLRKSDKQVIVILDNDAKRDKKLFPTSADKNLEAEIQQRHSLRLNEDLFFIGTVEFEDIFDDTVWYTTMIQHYPVADGNGSWEVTDIGKLRDGNKFSEGIQNLIEQRCLWRPGKPEIGQCIAEVARELNMIPETLVSILKHIETKASSARN